MPLRQIEVVIPEYDKQAFEKLLENESVEHFWQDTSESSGFVLKVLVDAAQTENFLDQAEQVFSGRDDYRLIMTTVEATLPRYEEQEEETEKAEEKSEEPWEKPLKGVRVSREELYSDISDGIKLSSIYILLVILSTIVAALGILRDNTAVVIGAMVIAPLLGPNVGLALATTLADMELGKKSLLSNITGLSVAFLLSVILGFILNVDISLYHISSRVEVQLSDIALALASGAAGVLAYTVGMSAAVIGVMVAVALLPPLVVTGLLAGDFQWIPAVHSALLLLTNIICVNLAAVTTFILQGVKPRTWYESNKATKMNKIAISIWLSLLIILSTIIYIV